MTGTGFTTGTWTTETTEEVAEGVFRIPLPMPNDGLAAVNTYLLHDADGPLLIDPGWAVPEAEGALVRGLARVGVDVRDVRRTLSTHVHRDHYTMAVKLRQTYGIPVALGEDEQASLSCVISDTPDVLGESRTMLRRHGADTLAEEMTAGGADVATGGIYTTPDTWLCDGAEIRLAERRLSVVATPGHTAGHVIFHDAGHGLLFAGDHVLPDITPSIGFEPVLRPSPLRDFLASLGRVLDLQDAALFPAHGHCEHRAHARAHELIEYHERRLAAILRALSHRERNAFDVANDVPWTRHLRRLSDLSSFNRMLAVLETGHHLTLLVERGLATSRLRNGHLLFRAVN